MPACDPKTYLWKNITTLVAAGDDASIDTVTARVKIGRGTVQRIREGSASFRLDVRWWV